MIYDDCWLQNKMEKLSIERFGIPFCHRATFNKRLRTTGGLYLLESHDIEINPKIIEKYDEDELVGIMVHELCHYHLHINGQGYQHKDQDFKKLLKQTGGLRYVRRLQEYKYHYKCSNCNEDYFRYRQMDLTKYCCGKCHGELYLEEEQDD